MPFIVMKSVLAPVHWEQRHYANLPGALLTLLGTARTGCTMATEKHRGSPLSCVWIGIPYHFVLYQAVLSSQVFAIRGVRHILKVRQF